MRRFLSALVVAAAAGVVAAEYMMISGANFDNDSPPTNGELHAALACFQQNSDGSYPPIGAPSACRPSSDFLLYGCDIVSVSNQ
jgi:hypothetical protein